MGIESRDFDSTNFDSGLNMSELLEDTLHDTDFQKLIEPLNQYLQERVNKLGMDKNDEEFIKFLCENQNEINNISYRYKIMRNYKNNKISMSNIPTLYELIKKANAMRLQDELEKYLPCLTDKDLNTFPTEKFRRLTPEKQENGIKNFAKKIKEKYDTRREQIMEALGETGNKIAKNVRKELPISFCEEIQTAEDIRMLQSFLEKILNDQNNRQEISRYNQDDGGDNFRTSAKLATITNFRKFQKDQKESEKQ